jgi:hypothetical protein
MIDSVSAVNEQLLGDGLERLGAAIPGCGELVDVFDGFVRTASDDELVRINPVRFAQQRELPTVAVVDLFLYARKLGLLTMEWQYVCPGCGEIVERLASLTSATAPTPSLSAPPLDADGAASVWLRRAGRHGGNALTGGHEGGGSPQSNAATYDGATSLDCDSVVVASN